MGCEQNATASRIRFLSQKDVYFAIYVYHVSTYMHIYVYINVKRVSRSTWAQTSFSLLYKSHLSPGCWPCASESGRARSPSWTLPAIFERTKEKLNKQKLLEIKCWKAESLSPPCLISILSKALRGAPPWRNCLCTSGETSSFPDPFLGVHILRSVADIRFTFRNSSEIAWHKNSCYVRFILYDHIAKLCTESKWNER